MLDAVTEKIEGKSSREVGGKKRFAFRFAGRTLSRSEPNSTAMGLESSCRCFPERGSCEYQGEQPECPDSAGHRITIVRRTANIC